MRHTGIGLCKEFRRTLLILIAVMDTLQVVVLFLLLLGSYQKQSQSRLPAATWTLSRPRIRAVAQDVGSAQKV